MRLLSKQSVVAAVVMAAVAGAPASASGSGDSGPLAQPAAVDSSTTPVRATSEPCEGAQAGALGAFYPGPAASPRYESMFSDGFALPHLSTHVPQGVTTWSKWNAKGQTLLVVSMYRKVEDRQYNSYLVGIDPTTGRHVGTVEVAAGHLGGIAIAGKFLFGQHADKKAPTREPVRRYRLSKLKDAFESAAKTGKRPYLGRESGLQTITGAGFMQAHGGEIWAGHYNHHSVDMVYRYKVDSAGKLSRNGAGYEAPARTQGLLVDSDRLVFNVSNGSRQGRIVVTDRKRDLDDATVKCFVAPSMGENMARIGDRVFVLYEGGSYRYPSAVNRVTRLHEASLTSLRHLPA
ncbi:MAG: hypothetical protein ACT4QF_06095 [Sporichthyaceae bacterium]